MLGNDIVDMNDERNLNRSGQKRFLDKLFTPSEQQLISASDMPDHMIWILWSIKESAYKVLNRSTRIRSYAPLSYEIQPCNALVEKKLNEYSLKMMYWENICDCEFLESSVIVKGFKLFAKTLVAADVIYSTVATEFSSFGQLKWGIEKTNATKPEQHSQIIRESAQKHIALSKQVDPYRVTISTNTTDKHATPPLVYIDNVLNEKICLSLTHDGPYLAYSYLVT